MNILKAGNIVFDKYEGIVGAFLKSLPEIFTQQEARADGFNNEISRSALKFCWFFQKIVPAFTNLIFILLLLPFNLLRGRR